MIRPAAGRAPEASALPTLAVDGVVAIVPAKDSASVGETVAALVASGRVEAVVVVDDGSTDDTAERARAAGALVVRPGCNLGKGDAVALGRDVAPSAATYLLVDADLGGTAAHVVALLDPLEADRADLVVAAFPPAAGRGGFGIIKRGSARLIAHLCGAEVREPLSGQRAVRGDLLRSLRLAPRFGLELGMTVDAVRAGARVLELPLPLDHAHTGRTVSGFRHRIRQGIDIVRTAMVRVGSPLARRLLLVVLALGLVGAALTWGGHRSAPPPLVVADRPVVLVTLTFAEVDDLAAGVLPNLRRLADRAGGVLAPRTPSVPADQASGYATAGAGAPVVLVPPEVDEEEIEETAGLVGADDETIGAGPFISVSSGADGLVVRSPVVPSADTRSYGRLGALGDALADAGVETAYVGARSGGSGSHAPAALVVADGAGRLGHLFPGALPLAPGVDLEARVADRLNSVRTAMSVAGVTVVDTGGAPVARPPGSGELTDEERARRELRRRDQLAVADRFIGALLDADLDATVLVAGMAPPSSWQLTPLVLGGTAPGATWSASTKRSGVAVLTDLAPTVLHLAGVEVPDDMVGSPIGVGPDPASEAGSEELAVRTDARERVYVPTIMSFVILQGVVYLVAVVALGRRRAGDPRGQRTLAAIERLAVAFAAFPVGSFLWRLLPADLQAPWMSGIGLTLTALLLAAIALRCRRTALSPLIWVAGLTVVVELWDAATSGSLQHVSLLGYTPVTAARFYGMGNMGFAILGASALLVAGSWIATAPNRLDALVAAGCLLSVVTAFEVAPSLGADFGGVLTFVPVFGAAFLAWAGMRFTWIRAVAVAAAGAVAVGAVVWWEGRSGGDGHLARFAQGDWAAMWEVVVRKASTNLRVMRITFWTWMVPIIVMFIIGSLTVGGGWRRWFGRADSWRVTFAALLGFSIVGGLVNDSGVVIPALALVYVGSFLLLVQSRQPFGPVSVLVPEGTHLAPAEEVDRVIELLVGLVLGLVVGAATLRAMAPVFAHELFRRQNYRGHELSTSAGLVVVVAVLAGALIPRLAVVWNSWAWSPGWLQHASSVLILALGFGLLGLLDDLVGVGESGGFRGHLSALARGRLTTGGIKLLGGAALAVVVVDPRIGMERGLVAVLRDGAVVSLAANLANLFDRAPGRVLKVGAAGLVALVAAAAVIGAGRVELLAPVAFALGASLALLPADLRESCMVGDAGSNVVGAVLGYGAVVTVVPGSRWIVLVVVLALNLASEVVSFSRVIDAVPPLRALDRWGSLRR